MLTNLTAAVVASMLVGLAPATWALTATDPGGAAESGDLAEEPPAPAHNSDADFSEPRGAYRRRIVELVAADLGDRAARFKRAARAGTTTENLVAELRAFLDEARHVEGPNRYVLTLAADVLAERLGSSLTKATADLPKGLTFEADPFGGCLSYRHDLVQGVLREAPEASSAHDLAFLMMLDMGLDPSVGCDAGKDQYHVVVREAEAFLSKRPDSKYRAVVTYLLAQAYETWWTISLDVGSEMAEWDKAREGAEKARERAVELYEQIVRAEPTSDHARHAKFVLPRLELRVGTGQYRFLCIYE